LTDCGLCNKISLTPEHKKSAQTPSFGKRQSCKLVLFIFNSINLHTIYLCILRKTTKILLLELDNISEGFITLPPRHLILILFRKQKRYIMH